jgi:hypothetical protein
LEKQRAACNACGPLLLQALQKRLNKKASRVPRMCGSALRFIYTPMSWRSYTLSRKGFHTIKSPATQHVPAIATHMSKAFNLFAQPTPEAVQTKTAQQNSTRRKPRRFNSLRRVTDS